MTIHLTNSGHVELLDQWGHGRAAKGDWARKPATLIFDDNDGHYDAWSFTGDKRDAAQTLARLDSQRHSSHAFFLLEGSTVRVVSDGSSEADEISRLGEVLDEDGELVEIDRAAIRRSRTDVIL